MEAGEKHGPHLRRYERREVANGRMKIISFFEENGEKVTKEAFGVDRKLIYISLKKIRWQETGQAV